MAVFFVTISSSCSKNDDDTDNGNGPPDNNDDCPELVRVIEDELPEEELLDLVQEKTIGYFWDFAEPNSGMARERNTSGNLVTSGGTGFGIMALIAGVERGFLGRDEVRDRVLQIGHFLEEADRFHGAWAHWMDGTTGDAIPFSDKDDGGDLVETAFLVQGLIAAREYFDHDTPEETALRDLVDQLWHGVDWQWYTQDQNVLYWHWSPNYGFDMNMQIRGWNETMIIYVLAAASPTHPVDPQV
ncbi:MAG: glucoamylase family protein, partial [Bacteroidota bacterium]